MAQKLIQQSTVSWMLNNCPQNLLTAQDELELGTRIQLGLKAQHISDALAMIASHHGEDSNYANYTDEEKEIQDLGQAALPEGKFFSDVNNPKDAAERAALIKDGQEAKDSLVTHNIKLVTYVAKSFSGYHMDLAELIQEGLIGCMVAADKYDPTLGFRFSTCAVPWIRQQINRFIQGQKRGIRLPVHVLEALSKINKIGEAYAQEHEGQYPTDEQIAELSEGKFTLEKIRLYRASSQPISSLNAIVGDEDDTEFGDLVPDDGDESPSQYTARNELHEQLDALINTLTPLQQEIIRMRYAFNPEHKEYTLEETGEKLGYTRERIRQLEEDAKLTMRVKAKGTGLESMVG